VLGRWLADRSPHNSGAFAGKQCLPTSRHARQVCKLRPARDKSLHGGAADNLVWMVLPTIFSLAMLVLDLGVFHRRPHEISIKEAAGWSGVWVALSLAFGIGLYFWRGAESGVQFFTGYIFEKSHSVDNLFLLAVIFGSLEIPPKYQRRTLFYGVLGAIILRATFIAAGTALRARFSWVLSVFGVFLLVAGVKLLRRQRPAPDPQTYRVVRRAKRVIPMVQEFGGSFFVRRNGRRFATPLFLALVMVEITDMVRMVDTRMRRGAIA